MKKKLLICVLALTLALAAIGVAQAETVTRMLEAAFPGVRIVIDGNAITPTDATGQAVEPFIVDGTTYLPVRAVADAFGSEVDWDPASYTVTLTSPTDAGGTTAATNTDPDPANTGDTLDYRSEMATLLYTAAKLEKLMVSHYNAMIAARYECWMALLMGNDYSNALATAQVTHRQLRDLYQEYKWSNLVQDSLAFAQSTTVESWADLQPALDYIESYLAIWDRGLDTLEQSQRDRAPEDTNWLMSDSREAYAEVVTYLETAHDKAFDYLSRY